MTTFYVQLSCCGFDHGRVGPYDNWADADRERERYATSRLGETYGPGRSHDRVGIIVAAEGEP